MTLARHRIPDQLSQFIELVTGSIQNAISITYSQVSKKVTFSVKNDGTTIGINAENELEVTEVPSELVSYNGDTLKNTLDDLFYVNPTVSLSGGSSYEKGQTVSTVNLSWTYNKSGIVSQSINQGIGSLDPDLRAYAHEGQTITTNRTYTITGNDGKNNCSGSATIAFYNKRYYGTSADGTLDDSEILAQLTGEFSTSRSQIRTFNCSGGQYFYIIYPSSWGTASFKVGGLSFTDMNLEVRSFTNASGYSENYNIYRPNNIQTGNAILVEVS
jgi:hypothetical protein